MTLQLLFEQTGFAPLVFTDNGPGDLDPLVGSVAAVVFGYGNFDFTASLAASNPQPNANSLELHITGNAVGSGVLRITAKDSPFTNPGAGPATMTGDVGGEFNAIGNSLVTVQSWANPDNLLPVLGPDSGLPAGSVALYDPIFTAGPGLLLGADSTPVTLTGPYSMFTQMTVAIDGPGGSFGVNSVQRVTGLPVAALGDLVWHDLNANGVQDGGEPGIPGATVKLQDAAGNTLATTTTNANGLYSFTNLTPGQYKVMFVLPSGFDMVSPHNAGSDDTKDSDADPNNMLMTQVVTLASGDNNTTLDAGFFKKAALGDFVWHDLNANGVQDAGEPGIAGATVNLKNASGTVIATTTTNASGFYSFTGLTPGTYSVQFVQPAGFSSVSPLDAGGDDTRDSDANPAMALMTATVTLASGETNNTLDAGFYNPAALGDLVWHDLNANGVQDGGEPGIPGATVKLQDAAGNTLATTTTNANGLYSFTNLTPGQYKVMFVLPSGFDMVSPHNAGSDDTKDSDADPNNMLMTQVVTLASGDNNTTLDAGFFKKAKLGDYVWHDLNGNGIQDVGEPGVGGVTVKLQDAAGNVLATTTTDGTGMYMFGGLNPGQYKVMFVLPAGFAFTLANQGSDDARDSDADTVMGMTQVVTLPSGGMNLTLDAGLVTPPTGGGEGCTPGFWKQEHHFEFWTVYSPTDKFDAVFGVTSSFGSSFTLLDALSQGGGGEKAMGRHAVAALLNSVSPGVDYLYSVSQVMSMVQQAYVTGDFEGTKNLFAAQNELGCDMHDHEPPPPPPPPPAPSSLSGFVYKDLDDDGVFDANESGIAGVQVRLTGVNDLNQAVDLVMMTLANGSYQFANLRPGTYKITETQPFDCLDGKDTLGSLGGSLANDMFSNIVLGAGVNGVNYNFGELPKPAQGGEGCTPGFWKQCQHFKYWEDYRTSDRFDVVFGVNAVGNYTLLQALNLGGGGEKALMRHAVAALLNAASDTVDYLYTVDQVIAMVQNAYATGSFEATKNLLAAQNELGCPDM